MINNIVLLWPVDQLQLDKIRNFREVMGDAIVYNFSIVGLDLTGAAIRGEIYDLNTAVRMANDIAVPVSAPEIVVTDTGHTSGTAQFTATVSTGVTSVMQNYADMEFEVTLANGQKFTIMQQPIHFTFQRIIWMDEDQNITNNSNENPLF